MSYILTKEQRKEELIHCGKNPTYFINNYVKAAHPVKGLIPLNLYPFQQEALKDFVDYKYNVILKARQMGISTCMAAYVAWLMLFRRNQNVVIMATKLNTAANLVKKVKLAIKSLPEWMMVSQIDIDNRNSFTLENGSEVKAISTSGDAGRSEAVSLLIIDEAAFVENMEDLWAGLWPVLSTGGRCIIASTPNGTGNLFHKLYTEAEQHKNDFNPMSLPWSLHPERDQKWFDKETRNMSEREIAQELLCSFLMSGNTIIDPRDIEYILKGLKDPISKTGFDRNLWIWENFNPKETYMLVADVSRGDGNDYSTFHIIKVNSMEIVAEYQGKLPYEMFAHLIYETGRQYGGCLVVVETTGGHGWNVTDRLQTLKYPNIYFSKKATHEFVDSYVAEYDNGTVPGFTTSQKTRPIIIAKLEEYIRNKTIKMPSVRLYNELKTFIWNNGKPEAMRGYNDDLIMACAIGAWVRDTALITNQQTSEYQKAMISAFACTKKSINTAAPGMMGYQRKTDIKENFFGLPFYIK